MTAHSEPVQFVDRLPGVVVVLRGAAHLGQRHGAGVADVPGLVLDVELHGVDATLCDEVQDLLVDRWIGPIRRSHVDRRRRRVVRRSRRRGDADDRLGGDTGGIRRDQPHLRPLRQQVEAEPTTLVELHPLSVGGQRHGAVGQPAQCADVAGHRRDDLGGCAYGRASEGRGVRQRTGQLRRSVHRAVQHHPTARQDQEGQTGQHPRCPREAAASKP